ncbi:MAG: hypothetical protein ACRER2_03220 [Methylococcales bacterium]
MRNKRTLGLFTVGIFIGEAYPAVRAASFRQFLNSARWWIKLVTYHLPCRLAILVGDGPSHDFHHRYPRHRDWSNYIYLRERDSKTRYPDRPDYAEVWGLHNAIQLCFESSRDASPDDYPLL